MFLWFPARTRRVAAGAPPGTEHVPRWYPADTPSGTYPTGAQRVPVPSLFWRCDTQTAVHPMRGTYEHHPFLLSPDEGALS